MRVQCEQKEHKEKIIKYIDIGEKEGATLVLDGRKIKIQGYEVSILGYCITLIRIFTVC